MFKLNFVIKVVDFFLQFFSVLFHTLNHIALKDGFGVITKFFELGQSHLTD